MKKTSKFLSVVLAVLMVLTIIPMTAFAAIPEVELDKTYTAEIPADGYVEVAFTPTESGKYVVISDNGGDDDNIDPYVDVYDSDDNLIAEDDDNDYVDTYNFYCIFEAQAGETYYIVLDCYNGDCEYDYIIKKRVEITHQPTADEPYVELNWDVEADYQWYSVEKPTEEITDTNADTVSYAWGTSSYNAETGWKGVLYDQTYYGYDYFTIPLEAGDTITVELTGDYCDGVGLYDYDEDDGIWIDSTGATNYEITVKWDADYTFYTNVNSGDVYVKAYMGGLEYTAINGETDSEFEAEKNDAYACKVTLEDGTVITSDYFEVTGLDDVIEIECDHVCHKSGIANFFFRIGLFFQRIFGANKYCECGEAHY